MVYLFVFEKEKYTVFWDLMVPEKQQPFECSLEWFDLPRVVVI